MNNARKADSTAVNTRSAGGFREARFIRNMLSAANPNVSASNKYVIIARQQNLPQFIVFKVTL